MNESSCRVDTFLDSSDFLYFYSNLISIVTLPVNILGILVIYYKTPFRMRNMKSVMLNSHICGLMGDLMLGTFTIPYIFFPLIGGAPLGIFTTFLDMNIFLQTYVAISTVGQVGSSIPFMFENRQRQTVTSSLKLSTTTSRRIFYFINAIVPFFASVVPFLDIPDQKTALIDALKIVPCPTKEYFQLDTVIVTKDAKPIGFLLLFLLSFYFGQSFLFIAHSSFHLIISAKAYSTSERTKKMKQKYFIAVCIQIFVPVIIIAGPIGYFIFSIITDYYNQKLNNLCFMIFGIHGCCATLATLLIYENYRAVIFRYLPFCPKGKTSVLVSKSLAETTTYM